MDTKNLYGTDKIISSKIKNRVDLNLYKKESDDSDDSDTGYV